MSALRKRVELITGHAVSDFNAAHNASSNDESRWMAWCRPVTTIIQEGPTCGMVALCMACDVLQMDRSCTSVDRLLSTARSLGISRQGELFDCARVVELVHEHCGRAAGVSASDCAAPSASEVVDLLAEGSLLLMPYDVDRNHGPWNGNGHQAHWALVMGMMARQQQQQETLTANDNDQITIVVNDTPPTHLHSSLCDPLHLHVFAVQGKSKHVHLWRYDALVESNAQLHEINPERADPDKYAHTNDSLVGLRNRCVILRRTHAPTRQTESSIE